MNESYYEALDDIENEILAHHIKLEIRRSNANFYAIALPTCPMIAVNLNKVGKKALPTVLLHEFAHVLLHTNYDYYNRISNNRTRTEGIANMVATELALKVFRNNDGHIDEFNSAEQLRENFGMPGNFNSNIEKLLKNK